MEKSFSFKSISFLSLVLILSGCATSGSFYMKTVKYRHAPLTNKMKIAVIPENWYWSVSSFLPRALITEFMDLGFVVIERSQLERILKEIKLEQTGVVKGKKEKPKDEVVNFDVFDKRSIKKLGEILGVDAFLVTYVIPTYSGNVSKATFRLVHTETSKVLFSTTFIQDNKSPVPIKTVIRTIAQDVKLLLYGDYKVVTEKDDIGKIRKRKYRKQEKSKSDIPKFE